jgi:transcriptional regulator with XRE-family HTH domain
LNFGIKKKKKNQNERQGGRAAVIEHNMIDHNTTDEVGAAIKSARLEKGMARAELAKRLDITPRHLGAVENDEKKPSFELLFHMIHELHITADRFFYPEMEHDHLELEEIILALCQGDDKRINTILTALHSLVVEKRKSSE